MPVLELGLIHTPVTPFTPDVGIDLERYGELLEFHLAHGAEGLALPMHVGESVSLSDDERMALLESALKRVNGRVPVLAHVSQSGTAMAVALAHHAEKAGAAAVIATTPYYWTPPAAMLVEHFAAIGAATRLPLFVYNAPEDMGGTKITVDIAMQLIDRLDTFAGVVDCSLDWQFMIDLVAAARRVRPGFQLVSGTEYLVSARAIGAKGAFCPLAAVAPHAIRELHRLCATERYADARSLQNEIAVLRRLAGGGPVSIKALSKLAGRDCGDPRPPLETMSAAQYAQFAERLGAMAWLRREPRGWRGADGSPR